jgi:hypothetical protein
VFLGTRTRTLVACLTITAGLTTALALRAVDVAAQSSPTITVTPTTVSPGGTITVTIANGPGNARDWVALYSGFSLIDWKYLNGSRTAPASGVNSAIVTFVMPSTSGTYTVQFLVNDTYTVLATSGPITVQANGPPPSITVTPTAVVGGGSVTVTVANGPGNARDWVALYFGASVVDSKYLNGLKTPPATGVTSATLTFVMPTTAGTYTFEFLSNDTINVLATSGPITVQASAQSPTVTVTPASAANGATLTVAVANGPGNAGDWVGLYSAAAGDSAYLDWEYLNGLKTAPTSGVTSATVTFSAPTTAGQYNVRFFANYGFTRLATSAAVTVGDVTPPSIALTAPAAGATVSGSVTVSANATDNVAVAGVQFKLDGAALGVEDTSSPYSVSWNTTTAPNGSHTLTAVARDAAGNQATSSPVTVTVNNDTTPPVLSAVAVSAITRFGATITWTTNEAADSEVEYGATTIYGGFSTLDPTLVTAHTISLAALTPGTMYHVRARSRDAAGNLGLSGDLTLTTLEGTPPTVSITAPAAGSTVSGTVTVAANATDNVAVAGVQFKVDSALLGAEDLTSPYSTLWNTTAFPNGSHTLTATARDTAGNTATSLAVVVTVANGSTQVSLAWDPNTEPQLAGYKVYVGTASGVYTTAIDVRNVTTYTVASLPPGQTYYFAVTAYDVSGFESGFSNEVSAVM